MSNPGAPRSSAVCFSTSTICALESCALTDAIKAATPATIGLAKEVPEAAMYAEVELICVVKMISPGAESVSQEP
jgi:hypothetical protein